MDLDLHKSLHAQQKILDVRQKMIDYAGPPGLNAKERARIDRNTFEDLKNLSPERLDPVLVRPSGWFRDSSYFAAFLIERTPKGGLRLLRIDKTWHITRIKANADVIRIRGDKVKEVHKRIVELQKECDSLIMDLVEKCHTQAAKDSINQKWKRPIAKSS